MKKRYELKRELVMRYSTQKPMLKNFDSGKAVVGSVALMIPKFPTNKTIECIYKVTLTFTLFRTFLNNQQ